MKIVRLIDESRSTAYALRTVVEAVIKIGDTKKAAEFVEEALTVAERIGVPHDKSFALWGIA